MVLPYRRDIIPHHRRGAINLLESIGYDSENLNPDQLTAIRQIFFLDDNRTVEQRIRDEEDNGSILTDGMEDATDAINAYGRDDL